MSKLTTKIRLAGGELDDIGGYLRGITDALTKGEIDDAEFLALQRYGETIFEASGKLKNYVEIWEAVHRAFLKAKAEGKEIEFLQLTGGESGVTDAIQALNRWEQAVKDADRIIKAKIDYEALEKADVAAKMLTEQTDELGKALSSAFQPATTKAAELFFEVLKKGTQWLIDHKTDLQEVWNTPSILFSPLESYRHMLQTEKAESKKLFSAIKNRDANLDKLFENSAGLERAHENLKKRLKESPKGVDPLQQYAINRTRDLKDAIADLRLEIDYENEYQKAVAQANLERERALRQIVVGDEERAAIEKKYLAEIEQAEKNHSDKMKDLWEETAAIQFERTHSAFEKEIYDIEQWKSKALEELGEYKNAIGDKNKWLQESAAITANALAKEAQAFEKEMDRIRDKIQSLQEKIFNQEHNQLDQDLYNLQKELVGLADEKIYPPELIQRYVNNELKKIAPDIGKIGLDYNENGQPVLVVPDKMFNLFDSVQKELDEIMARHEKFLTPDLSMPNIKEPIKQMLNAQDVAIQPAIEKLHQSIALNTSAFDASMLTATNAAIAFSNAIQENIPKINFDTPNFQIPISDKIPDIEIGKLIAPLDNITGKLKELTQIAGNIAQEATQRQQPNINVTVSPNISVNLGGAYVFDNAMKARLTDDIATEVANSVTRAVNQGISQINTSFAN